MKPPSTTVEHKFFYFRIHEYEWWEEEYCFDISHQNLHVIYQDYQEHKYQVIYLLRTGDAFDDISQEEFYFRLNEALGLWSMS